MATGTALATATATATATVPARAVAVVAPPIAIADGALDALAADTGRAWASTMLGTLRSQARAISGGWPGTLREARGQVSLALSSHRGLAVSTERLDALARTAYASARNEWCTQAEPDPEA